MSAQPQRVDGQNRYTGDRYDRLRQGGEILAEDPAVADAPYPFNGDGVRAFVRAVTSEGIFDGLTERDANTISMLLLLDYYRGPGQIMWRIQDWLTAQRSSRPVDDTWAVVSALAAALKIVIEGLASLHQKNDKDNSEDVLGESGDGSSVLTR